MDSPVYRGRQTTQFRRLLRIIPARLAACFSSIPLRLLNNLQFPLRTPGTFGIRFQSTGSKFPKNPYRGADPMHVPLRPNRRNPSPCSLVPNFTQTRPLDEAKRLTGGSAKFVGISMTCGLPTVVHIVKPPRPGGPGCGAICPGTVAIFQTIFKFILVLLGAQTCRRLRNSRGSSCLLLLRRSGWRFMPRMGLSSTPEMRGPFTITRTTRYIQSVPRRLSRGTPSGTTRL